MLARAVITAALIVSAGAAVHFASARAATAARSPLSELPLEIDGWRGFESVPLSDDVVATLGVDDYVNRQYHRGKLPIATYVGYYASQRSGDTIHSPQNCLPGAGWLPVASGPQRIDAGGTTVTVTRYDIVKGLDRQVVLYWYQGRGRVISGEYANKGWLMLDAARYGRSDGGLVRLIAPAHGHGDDALREVTAFAAALLPRLPRYLP
ncbi:MAG TPA: EpsI family protein [Vicinamibacterales bacterium]|nr:EpsI family protein [Vicinamibacterales bacterium]